MAGAHVLVQAWALLPAQLCAGGALGVVEAACCEKLVISLKMWWVVAWVVEMMLPAVLSRHCGRST